MHDFARSRADAEIFGKNGKQSTKCAKKIAH